MYQYRKPNDKERLRKRAVKGQGEYLRNLRKETGLLQREAAEIIRIPRCKISRYECNKLDPSIGTYNMMIEAYSDIINRKKTKSCIIDNINPKEITLIYV